LHSGQESVSILRTWSAGGKVRRQSGKALGSIDSDREQLGIEMQNSHRLITPDITWVGGQESLDPFPPPSHEFHLYLLIKEADRRACSSSLGRTSPAWREVEESGSDLEVRDEIVGEGEAVDQVDDAAGEVPF
jgi:hypothetical protein